MKKIIYLLTIILCCSQYSYSQSETTQQYVSVGMGYGYANKLSVISIPVTYHHRLFNLNKFDYTIGVRQNLAFGQHEFTINKQKANIDDISNYSLNLFLGMEWKFSSRLKLGGNIDLLGYTFGTRSYKTVGKDPVYYIEPENLSLRLGGANDKGSLAAELYLGLDLTENTSLNLGINYYTMAFEYKSSKIKDRTTSFQLVPYVQFQYFLWGK